MCSSKIHIAEFRASFDEALPLVPRNRTVFEDRTFKEVIKYQ